MSKSSKSNLSGSKTSKIVKPKKIDLSILFKKLKDELRLSADHVTDRDAVFAISQLVTLYLLEKQNKIEHFGLPEWINFSEIYELCQKDFKGNKYKIKSKEFHDKVIEELRKNESTTMAYQMDLPYTRYSTFKKLVVEIHNFFKGISEDELTKLRENGDILGQEYEELLKTQLVGRDDGQYFTNRNAVKLIVDIINPQIGETVYDPTCGTGGFIIYSFLHMLKKIKLKDFTKSKYYDPLCKGTFYGCDLDKKVLEILHSNLILHDIKHNNHFKNCNTIIDNQLRDEYDVVLSNFPFGRKGGKIFNKTGNIYDNLMKYYGCESSVLPLLLLKHTINILVEGGRAGIIVTTGELTNTGKDYNYFRKELVEENTLTKIIILPKGLFENAKGVSTAVICFIKGGKTDIVEYYNVLDITCQKMDLIKKVNRKQIKKVNYQLDLQAFDDENEIDYDVPMMKLKDICDINYGTRIIKKDSIYGKYPVYGGGDITFYTNDYNRNGKILVVSRFGVSTNCVRIINGKFWLNDSGMSIEAKDVIIQGYLNYIIKLHESKIFKCSRGMAQKNIDINRFKEINIPVPSIKIQEKIVEYLDSLFDQNELFSITQLSGYFDKIDLLKILFNKKFEKFTEIYDTYCNILNTKKQILAEKQFMRLLTKSVIKNQYNQIKIEDICDFLPKSKRRASEGNDSGIYPFYTSSKNIKWIDEADYDIESIIIGTGGIANIKYDTEYSCSADNIIIKSKSNKKYLTKYIYYFLFTNINIVEKGFKGTTIKHISKEYISNINIPIPSSENQQKIIEKMEEKENLIKTLKESIVDPKENIEIIMNFYIKQKLNY